MAKNSSGETFESLAPNQQTIHTAYWWQDSEKNGREYGLRGIIVNSAFKLLSPLERQVIDLRCGLKRGRKIHSHEEIAAKLKEDITDVLALENGAMRVIMNESTESDEDVEE